MPSKAPLKLSPAFKDYIWGGQRLKTAFNKKSDLNRIAESWELSAHKEGQSVLQNGLSLAAFIERSGSELLGKNCEKYDYFPLLIKLIDAKEKLSVQVHPSDEYALIHEGEYGKTEMWYVLDCDEEAYLYYGFSHKTSRAEVELAIKENRLTEILNKVPVKKGDIFFIPAGTIHAIGAGLLICEIQQNSNTTYRVYDYNRPDQNGQLRPLHVEKALEVLSYDGTPEWKNAGIGEDVVLAECTYFRVKRLQINGTGNLETDLSSFVSIIVTEGCGTLQFENGTMDFSKGDSIFIPAQNSLFEVKGSCELIITTVT